MNYFVKYDENEWTIRNYSLYESLFELCGNIGKTKAKQKDQLPLQSSLFGSNKNKAFCQNVKWGHIGSVR
ncbi:MAG: hypothetical protein ACRCUY_10390 [Thermoguttaceae bacterium]